MPVTKLSSGRRLAANCLSSKLSSGRRLAANCLSRWRRAGLVVGWWPAYRPWCTGGCTVTSRAQSTLSWLHRWSVRTTGPTSARAAVGGRDSLGSEALPSLGETTPRDNSAQSCLGSSGSKRDHYARAKVRNGRRLEGFRVSLPIFTLVLDSRGGSLNVDYSSSRARKNTQNDHF